MNDVMKWVEELREAKDLTEREMGEALGYKSHTSVATSKYTSTGSRAAGAGVLLRIFQKYEVRPPDKIMHQVMDNLTRTYKRRLKPQLEAAMQLPVWTKNGEQPDGKASTTRGQTMQKIAEMPQPTEEEALEGTALARVATVKRLKDAISDVYAEQPPPFHTEQPKSKFQRCLEVIRGRRGTEDWSAARNMALSELYEELYGTSNLLTAQRILHLKKEMGKTTAHLDSLQKDVAVLKDKLTNVQNELSMEIHYLQNAFTHIAWGGVEAEEEDDDQK